MPLRQWLKSANFAIEGILHAAKTQRHLRYHFYSAAAVLIISYVLGVTKTEFLIIALAVIAVLIAELFNSAVESMVDILSPEHSEKARIAKDIAAGAVFISAFGAAVIGYIILFPYLLDFFQKGIYVAKHTKQEIAIISFIIVLILVVITKAYFGRGHPLSGGMPSGHAALAFSAWVAITYITEHALVSVICFILALLIAQSRISTRTHRPSEVILGGLMGAAVTFLLFRLFS